MKTVFNPGEPRPFQCNGSTHELPAGESEWDDEIALHAQAKFRNLGVHVQYTAKVVEFPTPAEEATDEAEETAPAAEPGEVKAEAEPVGAAPVEAAKTDAKAKARSPRVRKPRANQ